MYYIDVAVLMSYEGVRDWLGRECRSLVSVREGKWEFGRLKK
jgi:hypothetical protein